MEQIDDKLLQFFALNYKPGIVGIVGTKDMIGLAIREAERALTADGQASLWSHCFILGDLRFDRRGRGGMKSKSPYVFESDLHVDLIGSQFRDGAQENWIGKWCKEKVENAAVIDIGLSEDQKNNILAAALQLVDEQALYPIHELLGTWWAIITQKQWLSNPVDDPHAMHCSAFTRYCYREAGRDFVDSGVSVSNTTPEHIAQAGMRAGAVKIYKP